MATRKAKDEGTDRLPGERKRYVWRLARFAERFEMEEYRRKGGLDYVRMFVTGSTNRQSNESCQFLQQLDELEHYYPEQRDAYEGRFWRLMRLTACQEDWLRGYLLDESRQALSESRIAARLHLPAAAMRETLKALKRVGLMEYVECPDFQQPPERPPEPSPEQDQPHEDRGQSTRHQGRESKARRGQKPGKQGSKRPAAEDSGIFGNSPKSFDEMTNSNSDEISIGNGQRAAARTQSQNQTQTQGQSQTATAPTPTPPEAKPNSTPRPKAEPTPRPGPIRPPEVTAGRQEEASSRQSSPGVSHSPRIVPFHGEPARLGSVLPRTLDGMTHAYSLQADSFADEIFALLRCPFAKDSREGYRELGNYRAALLDAVDASMPPNVIEELMAKGRTDAGEIGKHRKRYYRNDGSPETYWRFRWNQHFNARVGAARSPPKEQAG